MIEFVCAVWCRLSFLGGMKNDRKRNKDRTHWDHFDQP